MPDTQYTQRPYPGQNTGQTFNTNMTQQQQQAQAYAQQQEAWRKYYQQQQQTYNQIPAQAQMTQRQQQYGQQIQTAQIQHADYKTQINSKSKLAIIAIATLFGLILIGSVIYFMMPKQQEVIQQKSVREEAPQTITLSEGQELIKSNVAIDEIKFCSDIDQNFYCYEKNDSTFNIGDDVYVYVRIKGFSQVKREEGYLIGIKEDVQTLDPDGISVYQLSGTAANMADFYSEGREYLHIKNKLRIPADLKPGAYTFKVDIKDKITGNDVTQEKGFWLE